MLFVYTRSTTNGECSTQFVVTRVNTSQPVELLSTFRNQSGTYNGESVTAFVIYVVDERRLIFWQKNATSDNMVLAVLSRAVVF